MTKSQAKLRNLSFSAAIFGSKMAATTEMALDDLKKADEIISMAVLGSKSEIGQVRHQLLLSKNWPLGGALKYIW